MLCDAKDEVDSVIFKETQYMEVEPILVERKHGIEADSSKVSLTSYVMTESDKETVVSKTKEEKPSRVVEEEHIPAYLGEKL